MVRTGKAAICLSIPQPDRTTAAGRQVDDEDAARGGPQRDLAQRGAEGREELLGELSCSTKVVNHAGSYTAIRTKQRKGEWRNHPSLKHEFVYTKEAIELLELRTYIGCPQHPFALCAYKRGIYSALAHGPSAGQTEKRRGGSTNST